MIKFVFSVNPSIDLFNHLLSSNSFCEATKAKEMAEVEYMHSFSFILSRLAGLCSDLAASVPHPSWAV